MSDDNDGRTVTSILRDRDSSVRAAVAKEVGEKTGNDDLIAASGGARPRSLLTRFMAALIMHGWAEVDETDLTRR